jgi:hypothetical protein
MWHFLCTRFSGYSAISWSSGIMQWNFLHINYNGCFAMIQSSGIYFQYTFQKTDVIRSKICINNLIFLNEGKKEYQHKILAFVKIPEIINHIFKLSLISKHKRV